METHLHFYRLVEDELVATVPGLNSIVEPNFLFVQVSPILDPLLLGLHDLPWFQLRADIVGFDAQTECQISKTYFDPLLRFLNLFKLLKPT